MWVFEIGLPINGPNDSVWRKGRRVEHLGREGTKYLSSYLRVEVDTNNSKVKEIISSVRKTIWKLIESRENEKEEVEREMLLCIDEAHMCWHEFKRVQGS